MAEIHKAAGQAEASSYPDLAVLATGTVTRMESGRQWLNLCAGPL
ncbi:MAG: hypothetical protein P8Z75_01265 [Gammaproteobacteria bacterium]